jgi:hypothetical protein
MSQFKKFDCKLKWRRYDDDSAFDYDVYFNSTLLMYQVRQEYDLRFLCSINSSKFSLFIRVFYLKFESYCKYFIYT